MTPNEEEQLVEAIEQALKKNVTPTRSTQPCTCAVCEGEIAIGAPVIDLPITRSKTFTVCGDCFELYRICPGPRPME
jgi:hypothetical protein